MPLRPAASRNDIAEVERLVGVAFPPCFIAFLLKHDGESASRPWRAGRHRLLPVLDIGREWTIWNELSIGGDLAGFRAAPGPGVRDVWWHPAWIPLTANGAGDSYCLDLIPAPGGTPGQVITLWHDDGKREVVASSFDSWWEGLGAT